MNFYSKSTLSIVTKFILMALQLLVYLLINRQLSPTEFGNYTLLFANACFIQLIFSGGFDVAVVHFFSVKNFKKIFSQLLFNYSKVIAIILVLLFIGNYLLGTNALRIGISSDFLPNRSVLFLFYFASFIVNLFSQSFYLARGFYVLNNLILILAQVILIPLVLVFNQPDAIILSYAICNLMPLILIPFFKNKASVIVLQKEIKATQFWKYALVVAFINIVQFMAYRADYWLIDKNLKPQDLALYANAMKFSQLFWIIPNALATIIFRELSGGNESLKKSLLGMAHFVFLGLFIASFFYIEFGGDLVDFFLSHKYKGAANTSFQLLPGTLFFTYNILLSPYFSAQKKLWVNGSISFFSALFLIIADFILIPKYGLNAAIEVNNACYIFGGVLTLIAYIYFEKISWRAAWNWKQNFKNFRTIKIE